MSVDIADRVYGSLVGGAIGDALGAVVEGWPYQRVRNTYGRVEEFDAYDNPIAAGNPGSVTDDTVFQHCICLAIHRANGRITADDLAAVLTDRLDPDTVWVSEEIALEKLFVGLSPRETGRGSIPAATALMGIAPVGLINAGNPRQAYQDGYAVASLNQEGVEREGAAAFAAGIATAIDPDSDVDDVVETIATEADGTVYRALNIALAIAEDTGSVDAFTERFYEERLDWTWPGVQWDYEKYESGELFSASVVEILPAVVGILSLAGEDANRAIVESASFGRDADTIASATGNVVGATAGASALRDDWIEQVEDVNRDLFADLAGDDSGSIETMADHLIEALEAERQYANDRSAYLGSILD